MTVSETVTTPPSPPPEAGRTAQALRRLWGYLDRRQRWQSAWLAALVTLSAFTEMLTIGTLYPFIITLVAPDKLQTIAPLWRALTHTGLTDPRQLLPLLTVGFIGAIVLATATRIGLLWAQTWYSNHIGSSLSEQLYHRTLHQPYLVHASRHSATVAVTIIDRVNGVVASVIMPILTIGSSVILLLAIFSTLVAVRPAVALGMAAGLGGLYALMAALARGRLQREGRQLNDRQHLALKAVNEGLGGIREVLLDGTQQVFRQAFHQADRERRRSVTVIAFIGSLPRYLIEGLGMILIAATGYWITRDAASAAGAVPILGVIALGAQRLLPVAQNIYGSWAQLRANLFALEDVVRLMELAPLPVADASPPPALRFEHTIRLQDVGFRYGPGLQPVLDGITLEIPRGARIGVIGATGSGKSTLIDILMGLLPPGRGRLSVDGVPIEGPAVRGWQQLIAHVPQAIFLTDATLAENIAFGVPRAQIDRPRLEQAARQAQIAELAQTLPQGWDTPIGERGMRLSGGQRQRIGIARALYKQARVIVFDEATSALDTATERRVMEAIDALDEDLTLVLIAHRLSTLRQCDWIIELQGGRITRIGRHAEIVADHE
ncbi:MAG: hypothetical protein RIQ53_3240 [Pseudomonadota bacterium]